MRCVEIVRRCRSAGLGLMFSALGCGGQAEDGARPAPPAFSAPRATPTSPPVASAPQRPQPAPMAQPNPPPTRPRPQPQPYLDEGDPTARGGAENILGANCGQCHGPALTRAQAQAGINFIDDTEQLTEDGLIVPLSSSTSRIVVVMRDGSMPPPESGLPRVTEVDIAFVAEFIDNPRFWPGSLPPASVDAGVETPAVDAGVDGG
jgi:mono/diheme cytochrome c family protein